MDFFEKVKKTAASVVAVSGKESKKLYSISKLKLEIGDKQNSVKKLYKEIGFSAYKAFKAEKDIVEAIHEKLVKIDNIEGEIALLRKKIDEVKTTDEVGIDEMAVSDSEAEDAEVIDEEDEEVETEPIDPIL